MTCVEFYSNHAHVIIYAIHQHPMPHFMRVLIVNKYLHILCVFFSLLFVVIKTNVFSIFSRLQYFDGYGYRGTTFEHRYQCFSASFIDKV